jgi:hypothetical protein
MENVNKNHPHQANRQSQEEFGTNSGGGPKDWNDQTQIVNEEEQNRAVNTGDADYKENVTGRTQEPSPRDLNLTENSEKTTSQDSPGGAEIETPHKIEGDDESSTERKLPKM